MNNQYLINAIKQYFANPESRGLKIATNGLALELQNAPALPGVEFEPLEHKELTEAVVELFAATPLVADANELGTALVKALESIQASVTLKDGDLCILRNGYFGVIQFKATLRH